MLFVEINLIYSGFIISTFIQSKGGQMLSLSDFIAETKAAAKFPNWLLFIEDFPSWIPSDHTWPIDYGVSITFNEIEPANVSDGRIIIQFHQDERLTIVKKFLQDWLDGTCDPKTNIRRAPSELLIKATLIDVVDGGQPNKRIALMHPIICNPTDAFPCCEIRYSLRSE